MQHKQANDEQKSDTKTRESVSPDHKLMQTKGEHTRFLWCLPTDPGGRKFRQQSDFTLISQRSCYWQLHKDTPSLLGTANFIISWYWRSFEQRTLAIITSTYGVQLIQVEDKQFDSLLGG